MTGHLSSSDSPNDPVNACDYACTIVDLLTTAVLTLTEGEDSLILGMSNGA